MHEEAAQAPTAMQRAAAPLHRNSLAGPPMQRKFSSDHDLAHPTAVAAATRSPPAPAATAMAAATAAAAAAGGAGTGMSAADRAAAAAVAAVAASAAAVSTGSSVQGPGAPVAPPSTGRSVHSLGSAQVTTLPHSSATGTFYPAQSFDSSGAPPLPSQGSASEDTLTLPYHDASTYATMQAAGQHHVHRSQSDSHLDHTHAPTPLPPRKDATAPLLGVPHKSPAAQGPTPPVMGGSSPGIIGGLPSVAETPQEWHPENLHPTQGHKLAETGSGESVLLQGETSHHGVPGAQIISGESAHTETTQTTRTTISEDPSAYVAVSVTRAGSVQKQGGGTVVGGTAGSSTGSSATVGSTVPHLGGAHASPAAAAAAGGVGAVRSIEGSATLRMSSDGSFSAAEASKTAMHDSQPPLNPQGAAPQEPFRTYSDEGGSVTDVMLLQEGAQHASHTERAEYDTPVDTSPRGLASHGSSGGGVLQHSGSTMHASERAGFLVPGQPVASLGQTEGKLASYRILNSNFDILT